MNSVVKPSLANHTERTVFSFAQTLLLSRMNGPDRSRRGNGSSPGEWCNGVILEGAFKR